MFERVTHRFFCMCIFVLLTLRDDFVGENTFACLREAFFMCYRLRLCIGSRFTLRALGQERKTSGCTCIHLNCSVFHELKNHVSFFQILKAFDNKGHSDANGLVLRRMVKYLGWFDKLLKILDDLGIRRLAKDLRESNAELAGWFRVMSLENF